MEQLKAALLAAPAAKDAKNRFGRTALMEAARKGHVACVDALLAAGADRQVLNKKDQTAAEWALELGFSHVYARLDPEAARVRGNVLRSEFAAAKLVHVLSTRTKKDASQLDRNHSQFVRLACDPAKAAANLRAYLEQAAPGGQVRCYSPPEYGAFLAGAHGDADEAAGWAHLNWRGGEVGLERCRATGGCVLQLIVPPGVSPMQRAEAEAAADKGVRVLLVDLRGVRGEAYDYVFDEMPEVAALKREAAEVAGGKRTLPVPPTRAELERSAAGKPGPSGEVEQRL